MKAALEMWLYRRTRKNRWVEALLALMGAFYAFGVFVRHRLYDCGLLSVVKSRIVVVSVGNIIAGGSGKTPFVVYLASLLEKECRVAIVSRGYRSQAKRCKKAFLVRGSNGELLPWQQCGDEPYFLAERFVKANVIVGAQRSEGAELAHKEGCDLVILDDGMQHRRLARDVEIVMIEGRDPFGGGHFLPQGRLRESPGRLARADLIVINGAISAENRRKVEALTKAPIVQGEMKIGEVRNRKGQKINLQGEEVALFCAIGSPDRFVETIATLGGKVRATLFLSDHQPFTRERLFAFAQEAAHQGAHYLCCTEKDGIKLPLMDELDERLVVLKGEFIIKENEEGFKQVIDQITLLTKVAQ